VLSETDGVERFILGQVAPSPTEWLYFRQYVNCKPYAAVGIPQTYIPPGSTVSVHPIQGLTMTIAEHLDYKHINHYYIILYHIISTPGHEGYRVVL